jgi:phosphate butyryltransferase
MSMKKLEELVGLASQRGCRRLVVAVAQDMDVLLAVKAATEAGIIEPVLIGDQHEINKSADQAGFDILKVEVLPVADKLQACQMAVNLVRENKASILMKGIVSTSMLMKTILDKENGLLNGHLLSHVAFFESPYYHKVLCITDAALHINPDLEEKAGIVNNAVNAYHRLGILLPKVGILASVENINPKMEATLHAAILVAMQRRNQISGCLMDGPLALDNAISVDAARHKGIISDVAGDVDIMLVPDLNAGNMLYKSMVFLGGAVVAAVAVGAKVPVVLTSRSDSDRSKFLSIALAAAME